VDPDGPGVGVTRQMDLRHRGQGYELTVDIPDDVYDGGSPDRLGTLFYDRYEEKYGHAHRTLAVELITCRVSVAGPSPHVPSPEAEAVAGDGTSSARKGSRQVYFAEAGGYVDTPVYDRYRLGRGARFHGPAVIEERECTVVAGPSSGVRVDAHGNLFLDLAPGGGAAA